MDLVKFLEKRSKLIYAIAGIILIAMVGVADYLTGYELALSLFYLLPISLLTWFAGIRFGTAASIASALVWLIADITSGHPYSHFAIYYWNTTIRFGFFIIVALLLSALRKAHSREKKLARIDNLTGAVNSRFFYELMQMEIDRSQRNKLPFTLAYVDLDNFKLVNDNFGHGTGNEVLCTVVEQAKNHLRKVDVIARLGGDEFVFLFPETDQVAAHSTISKIQMSLLVEMRRNHWPVTFSMGVLTCIEAPQTIDELLKQADDLMYSVKKNGKNSCSFSVYAG